jgi:hypothetical protein
VDTLQPRVVVVNSVWIEAVPEPSLCIVCETSFACMASERNPSASPAGEERLVTGRESTDLGHESSQLDAWRPRLMHACCRIDG